MQDYFQKLINVPAQVVVLLIILYQHTVSPDHSWLKHRFPYGYCRHYPSCSEYGRQSIIRHGLLKGLLLALVRVWHCNPWSEPKVDLVPEIK